MSFDIKTASVLSGLTVSQLKSWAKQGVFIPEYEDDRRYSFRDIVAGRTLAFLRAENSAQKVKNAIKSLRKLNYNDHISKYRLGHDGKVILIEDEDGSVLNLTGQTGQYRAFNFGEVWEPFRNFKDEEVPALERPRAELRVLEGRLGGWPTVGESRIGFDVIAGFIDGVTVTVDNISHFYPTVTRQAAEDAIDFMRAVEAA